ncbi:MAG: MerR family DNA-binding protein [Zoogloeaceae bacterium]|uniref:MerR family transcriptional regulator n=1 Tax=Denitromonas sp. TaxID=2734609 RepID=UPI001E07AE2B|nr:MerR family DNA-binding protein [Rhodocyclaceae bacterium]MCP5221491.1 MerR family DNA-binding protein [Zoogloeaceae bacterium]HQU88050.1 MerR family DNA-binding protein [Denitromonas sp.]
MTSMTIGRLAAAAEVGVETVRYYQRRGLLAVPEPTHGQVRHYGDGALARLRFIRRAQQLGFSLDEIADLLGLDEHTDRNAARALAKEKLAQIDERMARLSAMRSALTELVSCCEHTSTTQPCPILHTLAHPDERQSTAYSKSIAAG